MSENIAISVRDLEIEYKNLRHMSIHQSISRKKDNAGDDTIRAVNGVTFDVKKGEILGIIGKNGSGKSTLLKAVANIFQPDRGVIDTMGNRVSLMSIGVGFNNEITGRENIMTSGMLLGFSPEYARQKMDEIIEFAELGDFIDKPVRTYSSGMYSKLSFAITAVMDTDILLVDEVLSVGDARFRKKSYEKMRGLIMDSERTVMIVSHSIPTLKELCNRVMWMHDGKIKMLGEPEQVLTEYQKFMA